MLLLPDSYVPAAEQTVENLKIRLLQMENIMARQHAKRSEPTGDSAFFTRSSKSTSQHKTHKPHSEKNSEYIKDLKGRTRCYNCGEFHHWSAECPHPRQDKKKYSNQSKPRRPHRDARRQRSEACAVNADQNSDSSNSASESDPEPDPAPAPRYFFMVTSRQSHALSVTTDKQAWFADSGATEHMTEHRDWFSTFKDIPSGTWPVTVADDRNLWVRGIGDINITRTVDGVQRQGTLQKVLFIHELRRNLFSIGLATKSGLSFQTVDDTCALYHDRGKGPKVMEGVQTGTLFKLSITHVPPKPSIPSLSTALTVADQRSTAPILWHNRMGHINMQVLKNMSNHNNLRDFTISFSKPPSVV
jgi:hypothetical protein